MSQRPLNAGRCLSSPPEPSHRAETMTQDTLTQIAVRPFHIDVPEEEIDELRRRVQATRWPEKETVADQSQGVPLATIQELVRYWGTDYDFRRAERPTAVHYRNRRPRHPLHPRQVGSRERVAAHHHARLTRFGHRDAQRHRPAHRSPGTRRQCGRRLDGQPPGAANGLDVDDQGNGTVTEPRLYQLIRQPPPIADRLFEIEFLEPGVEAFVFHVRLIEGGQPHRADVGQRTLAAAPLRPQVVARTGEVLPTTG